MSELDNDLGYITSGAIVDSGSNNDGDWVKFDNGFMICYTYKTGIQIACNGAWGSMYEGATANLGNFPQSFISVPKINVTPVDVGIFIESLRTPSTSSWGFLRGALPVNQTRNINLFLVAIGKWK